MSDDESKKGKTEQKTTKPNSSILLQNEILSDLCSTLEVIRLTKDLSKVRLKTFQHAADSDFENANKYHKSIISSTRIPENDLNLYIASRTQKSIKETYWLISAEITERLEEFNTSNTDNNTSKLGYETEIRLPALELPSFSGKYDEWLAFNNIFTASVHNRSNLDPVQKLHYLMKSVTGEAYNQIKNLSLTNENYLKARQILEEQYNHTRKVAHTYMKKLLECRNITNENSKDIRDFISNTKDCLASLNNLGLPTEHWDYILLFILQNKIPSNTLLKWEEDLGSSTDIPKFQYFLKFLENRFRTLEMVEVSPKEKDYKRPQKALHTKANIKETNKFSKNGNKAKSQAFAPAISGRQYSNKPTVICVICKKNHTTAHCNKFRNNSASVRRELAAKYEICFNCLGTSHTIEVCYSTKTCVYCKKHHHSLLHLHEVGTSTETVTTSNEYVPTNQQNVQQSSTFYASSDLQSVRILGTALVKIVNTLGYSITVRALLDSGADDNYIISPTVQSAGLKKYSALAAITGLNDVTVGSTEHKVNFEIQSLDGTFKFDASASVVETITSKMPAKYIDPENFGFLNNLPLADPHFNHPGKIHL